MSRLRIAVRRLARSRWGRGYRGVAGGRSGAFSVVRSGRRLPRSAQITLPAEFHRKVNLSEGDYLEAEAVENGILLKPVTVVEGEKAWEKVIEVMERLHAKQPRSKKIPKEEEIARVVKTVRQQHAEQRA